MDPVSASNGTTRQLWVRRFGCKRPLSAPFCHANPDAEGFGKAYPTVGDPGAGMSMVAQRVTFGRNRMTIAPDLQ